MERGLKRSKIFITSELKTLLKQCFRNPLYTWVPFEVWLDIVWKADLKSMLTLVSTSTAFKELVDKHLKHDVRFALLCRREDQIPIARRCLKMCAKDGDPTAIMHLGLARQWGGWGLSKRYLLNKAMDWLKKAAENGNVFAAMYMWSEFGYDEYIDLLEKTSSDPGVYHDLAEIYVSGMVVKVVNLHTSDAINHIKHLANKGDEYAQTYMATIIHNRGEELYWYTKAAEQGNYPAIKQLSYMYSARDADEYELFEKYNYKARLQQNL
jgi:hypothetical protein